MPVFDDDLLDKDVIGKSWGVYRHLHANESMLLRLRVDAGQELSFSVNLMGSADFREGTEYVTVTLYGHNTTDIVCEPDYTGWSRRLDAGLDQLRTFQTNTEDNGLHYEPFGVGFYRSLVACKGDAVVGDIFNLTITAHEDVPLSIGVGMAESFDLLDFLVMPYRLWHTWLLDDWSPWWLMFSLLVPLVALSVAEYFTNSMFTDSKDPLSFEIFAVRLLLLFSVAQFTSRLIQVTMYGGLIEDATLAIAMCIHILIPIIWVATLDCLYRLDCNYINLTRVLLFVYTYFALWQGYQLFLPLILCARVVYWGVRKYTEREEYSMVSQKTDKV